uniref:Uncharacterized protein n=1 Tax=Meloidogyne javanica TaxID=6303 RepID=A0A915LMP3_MELJA
MPGRLMNKISNYKNEKYPGKSIRQTVAGSSEETESTYTDELPTTSRIQGVKSRYANEKLLTRRPSPKKMPITIQTKKKPGDLFSVKRTVKVQVEMTPEELESLMGRSQGTITTLEWDVEDNNN